VTIIRNPGNFGFAAAWNQEDRAVRAGRVAYGICFLVQRSPHGGCFMRVTC
jgi:hypothetical protein